MSDGITIMASAAWVFDAKDAASDDVHSIHRCGVCKSLLLPEDVQDHFAWHSSLLHASVPRTQ